MSNQITLGPLTFVTKASDPPDANGVYWFAEQPVQGWGSPKGTLNVTQKPRSDGGWRSESFLTSRIVVLNGAIQAPTSALLAQARHALNGAVSLQDTTFSVTEYGETLYATVTRQDEVIFGDEAELWTTFSLQLVATDPLRYGPTVSLSTAMPSTSGGLTWPVTWPAVWAATVTAGTIAFPNPGNATLYPMIRVDGPCPGPIITHTTSGNQLVFASSLVLAAGEFLLIDMKNRRTLANGQSSRDGYLTSLGWFGLDPGANDIGCNGSSYDAGALFTVTAPQGAWQ